MTNKDIAKAMLQCVPVSCGGETYKCVKEYRTVPAENGGFKTEAVCVDMNGVLRNVDATQLMCDADLKKRMRVAPWNGSITVEEMMQMMQSGTNIGYAGNVYEKIVYIALGVSGKGGPLHYSIALQDRYGNTVKIRPSAVEILQATAEQVEPAA